MSSYYFRNHDEKKYASYLKRIRQESENLNERNKTFIRQFPCIPIEGDVKKPYIKVIKEALDNKEIWTLEDIFPEEIYPALDVMLGKELREVFILCCEKEIQFPYTIGFARKMIRSNNYRNHMDEIWRVLQDLIEQSMLGLDLVSYLKKDYDTTKIKNYRLPQIFVEIDRGNEEVINIIKDMILSDNNTNLLSYEVIDGIFKSDNKELVELTGKLLLAAKAQEGLRQAICERIDEGTQANFEYMFHLIYQNDLVRFSSVKRAISVITGIGQDYSDRITKKQLALINNVLKDKGQADVYVKSEDNVEALIGLWYKGSVDLTELISAMETIISEGKRNSILLVSYVLNIIQDGKYSRKVAKLALKKYAKDEETFEKNDALEIIACYSHFFPSISLLFNSKSELKLTDYYKDEKEAREFFDIFDYAIRSMKKKTTSFSPCIFPWYSVTLDKEALSDVLLFIAYCVKGDLTDRGIDHIKFISSFYRGFYITNILENPTSQKQKDTVVEMLGERTAASLGVCAWDPKILGVSEAAKRIILKHNLIDGYRDKIEGILRLKTPEIRQNAIEILYSQDLDKVLSSVSNLISQKDVNKRLAGLDLMGKLKVDNKIETEKINQFLEKLPNPTTTEEILIEQLRDREPNGDSTKKLYDENYCVDFDIKIEDQTKKSGLKKVKTKNAKSQSKNKEITVKKTKSFEQIHDIDGDELLDILKKLNALYIKHENYEYKSFNEDCLLANGFRCISDSGKSLEDYPLAEVWDDFYVNEIKSFDTLYQLYMLLCQGSFLFQQVVGTRSTQILYDLTGIDIEEIKGKISEANLKYLWNMRLILSLLYKKYREEHRALIYEKAKHIMLKILEDFDINKLILPNKYLPNKVNLDGLNVMKADGVLNPKNCEIIFEKSGTFQKVLEDFELFEDEEEFKAYFAIKHFIFKKLYEQFKNSNKLRKTYLDLIDYAQAIKMGLIEKDEFYIRVLDQGDSIDSIRKISSYINGNFPEKTESECKKNLYDGAITIIKNEGQKIIDAIVSMELKRGDSPTEYSKVVQKIERIEGIDNLIKILIALGNLKLDRKTWYYQVVEGKNSTLSHLLKVCYPGKDDNAQKLKAALKNTDITEKRMIEVAMYASQWADMIEEYLGWPGLAKGTYYFQAHICDVDKKNEALFARHTPLSIEDLSLGAFDIDWFNTAYQELGNERFQMLYESAKYISDGAKHSRARKFADAVLGNLDINETEAEINAKRNKDLVASYGLIPLSKGKAKKKDMLQRYNFLQNFLKESKKFGAQRKVSEAKAVEIALDNLARNAGFSDVTRLIWVAETGLIKDLKPYFEPKNISGIETYLQVDDFGKASIVYEKDGKALKSVPAKLKKEKYIDELKDAQKKLKDQYSRSKKMLEESMEDAVEFYGSEIDYVMKNNVVIRPLLKNLVFKVGDHLGFYTEKELVSVDGKKVALKDNDIITIAHCLDLYQSKEWATYQKYLFDNKIKQPFKQVFRELYVKTEDERGKDTTLRYSGHQVQPAKTIAVLKNRRWVVDAQEGLQKVYYKQNIIAKIYALADWFSPADIEAPTIECVNFYDRKTFKRLLIDDIPDLIFSEVMRDVDLAVSVAHVGGVDPETSHSTIEMRKAIVEFNLPLFKIDNVSFTEKHAIIKGSLAEYNVHLGSGLVHQKAGSVLNVIPVHSQHRGKLFLPFMDEDPKTAEIMAKILLFAADEKIKDPSILRQINLNK